MPVYFPLRNDGNHSSYSPILYEDTMSIFSGYNVSTTEHHGDVLTMFKQIPKELWYGFVVSFFVFVQMSFIGARLLKQPYASFWMTVCAFLDQDNFPSRSAAFVSILSFVTMTGLFFMTAFGTNSMGTDLVTIDKPMVITTYDQIIGKGIKMVSTPTLPEWERFHSAPSGSKERALFEVIVPMSVSPTNLPIISSEIWNQKLVAIQRPFAVTAVALAIMSTAGFPKDRRAFIGPDPNAKKYTNVFVMRAGLKGSSIENRIFQV